MKIVPIEKIEVGDSAEITKGKSEKPAGFRVMW